jgi:hypothetical protein
VLQLIPRPTLIKAPAGGVVAEATLIVQHLFAGFRALLLLDDQ